MLLESSVSCSKKGVLLVLVAVLVLHGSFISCMVWTADQPRQTIQAVRVATQYAPDPLLPRGRIIVKIG